MPDTSSRPIPWGKVAAWSAAAIPLGTLAFLFFGLTVGLITGLVVVMAPLYVLCLQATLTTLLVSLCLWRGLRVAAQVAGAVVLVTPASLAVLRYVSALRACESDLDPAACLEYLRGSPPLTVVLLGTWVVVSLGALIAFFPALRRLAPPAA